MILRHALLAAVITGLAATTAHAQTPPPAPATPPTATTPAPATKAMPGPQAADAKKLIGRNIKNAEGDTIGEIKSVYLSSEGKVDSVMVGVGGFLGVGEREVQLGWKDLQIADNGEKVTVNMTKDQLKAMAPYSYKDTSWRGNVFTDRGIWTEEQRAAREARSTTDTPASAARERTMTDGTRTATTPPPATMTTESTGDFNAAGDVSANAMIGAKIRNEAKDTIGAVEDLYLDAQGAIKTVVVSVGGFLGIGAKDVAIKWSDLKQSRDGKSLVLLTSLSKDELKALPDYSAERRKPAGRDQAAMPK
jgi:sporulation protein YlmC with PRC-barrel domain